MDNSKHEPSAESIEELQPSVELDASDAEAVKGGVTAQFNPKELSVDKVKWELSEFDATKSLR